MEEQKSSIAVDVVKFGISFVVGIGCEVLCSSIAGRTMSDGELSRVEKISAGLAGAVVGGMLAEKADDYISRKVDSVMEKTRTIVGFFRALHENPDSTEVKE